MADTLLDEAPVVRVAGDEAQAVIDAAGEHSVPVAAVGSTGAKGMEPLAMVTREGSTAFYPRCDADTLDAVAMHAAKGRSGSGDAAAVVEHDATPTTLPIPRLAPLDTGVRRVLARCGWVRPTSPADYEASGGFEAIDHGSAVLDVTVHGRGWGDAANDRAVQDQWRRVQEADGEPVVVVNAHGSPADRLLLESDPFAVIEGALLVAHVVDATDVVVYVNEADTVARATVREAIEKADANHIDVVTGPDAYDATEMTMALEAIEGNHRLEARLRPPGPAEYGVHGRPTVIHTPRTLAAVLTAVTDGVDPPRVFTVTGDVSAPTTLELPSEASVGAAVDAVGVDGAVKAAVIGGKFGGLTADVDATVQALLRSDVGPGDTIEVLNDSRCIVEFVGTRSRFAQQENCGRCVPCREGTTQLTNLLREIYAGEFRAEAIDELIRVMAATSLCRFGIDAPRPVRSALAEFEAEFIAHADGTCPTGACDARDPVHGVAK